MEAFIGFFCGLIVAGIAIFFLSTIWKNQLEFTKKTNVLDDLDLATTDQLLEQFRNRPNNSYILLLPIKTDDEQGLKIECNSFSPHDSISMLHLATNLMIREMKNRGIATPDLPDFEE